MKIQNRNLFLTHGLLLLCIVLTNLFVSFSAFSAVDALFAPADKAVSASVELFEFDSAAQQKSAIELAKSLRCPQCQNQNLVESNSPIAKDLRLIVFNMVKNGKSDQEIVEYMTDRFGDFVLYNPPFNTKTAILWMTPVLLLLLFIIHSFVAIKRKK